MTRPHQEPVDFDDLHIAARLVRESASGGDTATPGAVLLAARWLIDPRFDATSLDPAMSVEDIQTGRDLRLSILRGYGVVGEPATPDDSTAVAPKIISDTWGTF